MVVVMPETMSKERMRVMKIYGADLVLTPAKDLARAWYHAENAINFPAWNIMAHLRSTPKRSCLIGKKRKW